MLYIEKELLSLAFQKPRHHTVETEVLGNEYYSSACVSVLTLRVCVRACVFASVLSHRGDELHMQSVFTALTEIMTIAENPPAFSPKANLSKCMCVLGVIFVFTLAHTVNQILCICEGMHTCFVSPLHVEPACVDGGCVSKGDA